MNKKCVSIVLVVLATLCSPSIPATADATSGVRVSFEGNRVFTEDQLRSAMSSREHSRLTRGSNVTEELQQGLQRLREFLMAEGYLTPRFGKPRVEDGPTGLIFKVHLEEGPLYRLGEIKVTGATVFSERQIIEALDMKQGDTFRGDTISPWFERVKEMYTNAGYLDFTPIPRQQVREPDSASSEGTVILTIDLDEGVRGSNIEQRPSPELRPSPLEAFAARPTARVIWSQSVGQLESQDARAMITALVVEEVTSSPSLMSGLRIDLAHGEASPGCDWKDSAWRIMCERPNAAVYVEEAQLQEVRMGLERGAAALRPMGSISRYEKSVNAGTGMILMEKGLIVCGYQFSDREPKDLAALLTKAIEELKTAPQ